MHTIDIQIVHGNRDIEHLKELLIPSVRRATVSDARIWLLNYEEDSDETRFITDSVIEIVRRPKNRETGFGENHNHLFEARGLSDDFIILNPDCILTPGSIDQLLERREVAPRAALIEGRQWPYEHPKWYDEHSFETPWASGAFALVSGEFFSRVGGFDERYFLYLEDVDLSWQGWLNGYEVLYEPDAVVMHFSGGPYYRADIWSAEETYGSVNFLALAKKFFGDDGFHRAVDLVHESHPQHVSDRIVDHYYERFPEWEVLAEAPHVHRHVVIHGFNRFHDVRT